MLCILNVYNTSVKPSPSIMPQIYLLPPKFPLAPLLSLLLLFHSKNTRHEIYFLSKFSVNNKILLAPCSMLYSRSPELTLGNWNFDYHCPIFLSHTKTHWRNKNSTEGSSVNFLCHFHQPLRNFYLVHFFQWIVLRAICHATPSLVWLLFSWNPGTLLDWYLQTQDGSVLTMFCWLLSKGKGQVWNWQGKLKWTNAPTH